MKIILGSFIFIFAINFLHSQKIDFGFMVGKIIADSGSLSKDYFKYEFPSILNSKNKIEIRFISSTSRINSSYLILSYDKEWKLRFHCYEKATRNFKIRKIKNKSNLDSLFSMLVSYNIFSIPDQHEIKPEMKYYNPKADVFLENELTVYDGGCSSIEFKIGKYYRRYGYCNCKSYQEKFPLTHEYKDYRKIEDIFYELEYE